MIWVVLVHLVLFQGMFFAKNLITSNKIGSTVKGKNREANIAITLFVLTYISLFISIFFRSDIILFKPLWEVSLVPSISLGLLFLLLSLVVAAISLIEMRESWRVGIKDNDEITLITSGIYSISRNPYFLSYFLQFLGYILLCPAPAVLLFIVLSVISVHRMVLKEEQFLSEKLGDDYLSYSTEVYRYLGRK